LTPESLSDDNEVGVYTQQLKTVSSSAKSVSYNKSIQEKQTLPLSPTRKPAYKSPIHKGFNEALEAYKNALKPSDLPSKSKKLDSTLDEY
jgi:hypothetical protein